MTRVVTVRMPVELHERLKDVSVATGKSMNTLAVEAVEAIVASHEVEEPETCQQQPST